jgi:hypothetical protein
MRRQISSRSAEWISGITAKKVSSSWEGDGDEGMYNEMNREAIAVGIWTTALTTLLFIVLLVSV